MRFLIGTEAGGLMEDPEFRISSPFNIIEAESEEKALEKYNTQNKCTYFYGSVIAVWIGRKWWLTTDTVSQYKMKRIIEDIKDHYLSDRELMKEWPIT